MFTLNFPTMIILCSSCVTVGIFLTAFINLRRKSKTVVTIPVTNDKPDPKDKRIAELETSNRDLISSMANLDRGYGRSVHPGEIFNAGDTVEVIGSANFVINDVAVSIDPTCSSEQVYLRINGIELEGAKFDRLGACLIPNGKYKYEEIWIESTKARVCKLIKLPDEPVIDPLERRRIEGNLDGVGNGEGLLDLTMESDLSDDELTNLFPPANGKGHPSENGDGHN